MNLQAIAVFAPALTAPPTARVDEFIAWGRPNGGAGINHIHSADYSAETPYFSWSSKFFGSHDKNNRSWFLKHEYLHMGRSVFKRVKKDNAPEIIDPDGVIPPSRYLAFAKTMVNVLSYYRNLRTPAKSLIFALTFLERALRDLNDGENFPEKLSSRSFEKALTLVEQSTLHRGKKYDIGKELEAIAGMVQSGYRSKSFSFSGRGFYLLAQPFSFTSWLNNTRRKRAESHNLEDLTQEQPNRISGEDVAAVGLAYRRANDCFGMDAVPTFMASIAGLALTTISMRVSDALTLRRDAVYVDEGAISRVRIRLARPKIATSQDLPIARNLSDLAQELFDQLIRFSHEAHLALQFYVGEFGGDFEAIDQLYVPASLTPLFNKPYMSPSEVYSVMGLSPPVRQTTNYPARLGKIQSFFHIDNPGDIWNPDETLIYQTVTYLSIATVENFCFNHAFISFFPNEISKFHYISKATAEKYIRGCSEKFLIPLLAELYASGRQAKRFVRTEDLKRSLLAIFKSRNSFPHWPYVNKDKVTRVDQALLVWYDVDYLSQVARGDNVGRWWIPGLVSPSQINSWLNASGGGGPPFLFEKLAIKRKDGSYPAITLQGTRRYHHTTALLAGAHEVFIDELAGRTSGRQSDHYDMRTPHEILATSIATFDHETHFAVKGPVAILASKMPLTDRESFLYKNAAPKHVTEIGGCATDWSLDPCKQYGDCMRCDQHLWRKGDASRLINIEARRSYALDMLNVADKKLKEYEVQPRSLLLQAQQFRDDLARSELIIAIESDQTVALGTIITFAAAPRAMGAHELTLRLANETRTAGQTSGDNKIEKNIKIR